MKTQNLRQQKLKQALRNREQLFAAWVSYGHPSITETFAKAGFDFIAIDMEHSTISLTEGQRIIAACQSEGVPCLPRPVSHSNDYIKPLLETPTTTISFSCKFSSYISQAMRFSF